MTGEEIKLRRKELGLTQLELSKKIGVSVNTVVNYEKGKTIPDSKLSLLNSILLVDEKPNCHYSSLNVKTKTVDLIPLYDIGSTRRENSRGEIGEFNPIEMIDVGDILRDSKSAMRVYGNSMIPNYPSGCIVGLNEVKDNIINFGDVYVIETIDNRYIKRIYDADDSLECYSDNISKFTEGPRAGKYCYETFNMPKESVIRVHRVVGVIIRNQNGSLLK
ncbi:hypothetical protein DCS32_11945 [Dokdonia sp. Dokd-P16]|uniref:LexA family transcriptional regulator n=1 Tax=Dokdonia sp. Dokd-P16 TaxID=2173169 RepID=UPI000D5458DA|nr:LexA family transcriptional regulator [Dokdonia sp. Dokd-P16]AWH74845.1 hypothetical protein DCS32_11945 [Dokdonia sp. Dokd-P16]